ncbi:hypothetical protein HZC30_06535 [Candidatus Woesearchaeota archaeon]|nr:hypothetical protein [Candidatus Woesearchaeota archaeon]
MMKIMNQSKVCLILVFLLLLSSLSLAQGEFKSDIKNEAELNDVETDNPYAEEFNKAVEGDIYSDVGEVELKGTAGLTPDSNFYFLESLIETVLVGDDPETALKYKEEKILEAKEMIESGDKTAAKKALEKAGDYNEIIQKEVSPEVELKVRESSKAVKEVLNSFESELEDNQWKDVQKIVAENLKEEDKIALTAKISKQIEQLCRTLSELDPLEYSNICKTDADAPKWKKELDRKLTAEQEKEAREFFTIMSECFQNPSKCRCEDISIKPFAERCSEFAPLAAKCSTGDKDACKMMDEIEDPINLLPNYLQKVMEDVEDKYGDAKHELSIPSECIEAGATSREACMKVMFKVNAPPECSEALEAGKINPKNEREAREACEKIMFNLDAPEECIEAGLKDQRECDTYMFKLDAPPECVEAGLTGSSKDDWKKCEAIKFKLDAPPECIEAGLTGSSKDDWKKCELIRFKLDAPSECIDAGLTGSGRDDWKKCEAIRFRLDAPQECLDAGLDGSGKNDWRKCEVIKFKSEAHPDCLAAGLTGEKKDDWKKCQVIQFKAEAPPECLDAGLTGAGRRDWDECDKIRRKLDEQKGQQKKNCAPDELHICDDKNLNCKCVKEEWQSQQKEGEGKDYKKYEESECKDGCNDECPGASRTDCVNNHCQCYFDDDDDDSGSPGGQEPVVVPPNEVSPPTPPNEGTGESPSTGDAAAIPPSEGAGESTGADTGTGANEGGSSNSGSGSEGGDSGSNGGDSSESSSSSEGGGITGGAVFNFGFWEKLKGWFS